MCLYGTLALAPALASVLIWFSNRRRNPKGLPYPPGPQGYPLIGNLLDMPREYQHEAFSAWSAKYGDMVYVEVLQRPILILNSLPRIQDLLEKRSTKYSDRPAATMFKELMGWKDMMTTMDYGPRLRLQRKVFSQFFTREAVQKYRPLHLERIQRLVSRLAERNDDSVLAFVHDHMSATIARLVYSIDIEEDRVYTGMIDGIVKAFEEAAIPGRFLVDALPFLKHIPNWFPGAGFKRFGANATKLLKQLQEHPFRLVEEKMSQGMAEACIASELIEKLPPTSDPTRQEMTALFRQVTAIAHIGVCGVWSVIVMKTFLYAMSTHQSIQRKAQEEIDREVDMGRLPNFDDRQRLPYVNAVVKESMRWITVGPFAFPHALAHDDEYDGYFIPKGTVVLPNTWAIQHDPTLYTNPFEYNPDRFLDHNSEAPDPAITAFGYGRRICPGSHFALDAIYIFVVSILATFDVLPQSEEALRNEIKLVDGPLG
ncbi:cytochrome P50 [Coprinopsis marcescibilis]|uniref:Cytochrome P50 n=1 Tax=Coprinopsis marcescibilis TaxID=230819 RepID=A0A5C3L5J1_COPMA|nr:cytochrome P50 [Coprinopsis marcescibilis]